MTAEGLTKMATGFGILLAAGKLASYGYTGMMWFARTCPGRWTKSRREGYEGGALLTVSLFPVTIVFFMLGEKVEAALMSLCLAVMASFFFVSLTVWPSVKEGWKWLKDRRR